MCNFRSVDIDSPDCTSCIFFTSYQAEYEDELEPAEYGTCPNVENMVGEELICDLFKSEL